MLFFRVNLTIQREARGVLKLLRIEQRERDIGERKNTSEHENPSRPAHETLAAPGEHLVLSDGDHDQPSLMPVLGVPMARSTQFECGPISAHVQVR